MVRVVRQAVIAQDKVTFQLLRTGLISQANFCNSRLRCCYGFARPRWPVVVALITALLAGVGPRLGVGVNLSRSAPRGAYHAIAAAPAHGALVLACLPAAVAAFGRARGYLGAGACPAATQPVLKTVGALAGDIIELRPDGVTVNAIPFLAWPIETRDSAARPLPYVAFGSYRVARDEIWLFGVSHARSWDSRYFGAVPQAAVRSVVRPLLTME